MPTVAFATLGCKVNQYDTQVMREAMRRAGYSVIEPEESADIYVVNTCTVTSMSDRKSRNLIRRFASLNPNATIVVTGCYAERQPDKLKNLQNVAMVLSNKEKPFIDRFLSEFLNGSEASCSFDIDDNYPYITGFDGQTRAFVKIENGCDSFCTYCIVPYVRGSKIQSRPIASIINEAQALAQNGFREIVLTGIHLGAYGKENHEIGKLHDVIKAVHEVDGIKRIRLSSIEPMDVTDELISQIAILPKCAHHFHISLQSGSDRILRLMRRGYSAIEFEEIIDKIRTTMPDVGISTDIMVGFPGESELDFMETYKLIEKVKFCRLHVFRYSPREGTPAEKFPNRIPDRVSDRRSHEIIALGNRITKDFLSRMINQDADVLIEDIKEGKDNLLAGFTSNYSRVLVTNAIEAHIGQIIKVNISGLENEHLVGSIKNLN